MMLRLGNVVFSMSHSLSERIRNDEDILASLHQLSEMIFVFDLQFKNYGSLPIY